MAGLMALALAGCSKASKVARQMERANRYYEAQDFSRAEIT
jgi:uncharacterized lipoprotein